jgi:hypothetical protein
VISRAGRALLVGLLAATVLAAVWLISQGVVAEWARLVSS